MAKLNGKLKKAGATLAKAAVPIATAVVVSRLTTGKIDLKGALLGAAADAIRAAQSKHSERKTMQTITAGMTDAESLLSFIAGAKLPAGVAR